MPLTLSCKLVEVLAMICAVFFLQNQAQDSDLLSSLRDKRPAICNRGHPGRVLINHSFINSGKRYSVQQLCNVSYQHSSVLLNFAKCREVGKSVISF